MPKNKTIKKEDLKSVIKAYRKWYKDNDENEETNNMLWAEWKNACVKAFPNVWTKEWQMLKNISRDIAEKDFETIVKVYQALGYEII